MLIMLIKQHGMISLSFLHNSINKSLNQGKSHHVGKVTTPLPPSYAPLSWTITQPRLEGSMVPPKVSTLNWYVWWMVCKPGMVVVTLKMLEATTTSDMATILLCVPLGHLNLQVCTKQVLGPICRAKITIVERRVDYVLKRCYPL